MTILLPTGTMKSMPSGSIGMPAIADVAIGGEDDGGLVAQAGQLDRQGAADVGQPAGLGKGNGFAGGQEDIHAAAPSSMLISVNSRR